MTHADHKHRYRQMNFYLNYDAGDQRDQWLVVCRDLRTLCSRLFMLGTATGIISGTIMLTFEQPLIETAIRDTPARKQLMGRVWLLVCLCQPINAGARFVTPVQASYIALPRVVCCMMVARAMVMEVLVLQEACPPW